MRRWGCAIASFDRQRRCETEVLDVFAQAEDVAGLETVRVGVATHSTLQSYTLVATQAQLMRQQIYELMLRTDVAGQVRHVMIIWQHQGNMLRRSLYLRSLRCSSWPAPHRRLASPWLALAHSEVTQTQVEAASMPNYRRGGGSRLQST